MKTEKEYFDEARETAKKESDERRKKWRDEILEEISEWDFEKLKEKYIQSRLARISYYDPVTPGILWDMFKQKCRFCELKYMYGDHENCCDNCWDKNKDKTLSELE